MKARELILFLSIPQLFFRETLGITCSWRLFNWRLYILVSILFCEQLISFSQPINLSNNSGSDPYYIFYELLKPLFIQLPCSNLGLRVQPAERYMIKMRYQFRQVILSYREHMIVLIAEIRSNRPAFLRVNLVIVNRNDACPEQMLEYLLCLFAQLGKLTIRSSIHLIFFISFLCLPIVIMTTKAGNISDEIRYTSLHIYLNL